MRRLLVLSFSSLFVAAVDGSAAVELRATNIVQEWNTRADGVRTMHVKARGTRTFPQGGMNGTFDAVKPGKRQGVDLPSAEEAFPIAFEFIIDFAQNRVVKKVRGIAHTTRDENNVDTMPLQMRFGREYAECYFDGEKCTIVRPSASNERLFKRKVDLLPEVVTKAVRVGEYVGGFEPKEFPLLFAGGFIPPPSGQISFGQLPTLRADPTDYSVRNQEKAVNDSLTVMVSRSSSPESAAYHEYIVDTSGPARIKRFSSIVRDRMLMQIELRYDKSDVISEWTFNEFAMDGRIAITENCRIESIVMNQRVAPESFHYQPVGGQIVAVTNDDRAKVYVQGRPELSASSMAELDSKLSSSSGIALYLIGAALVVAAAVVWFRMIRKARQA